MGSCSRENDFVNLNILFYLKFYFDLKRLHGGLPERYLCVENNTIQATLKLYIRVKKLDSILFTPEDIMGPDKTLPSCTQYD